MTAMTYVSDAASAVKNAANSVVSGGRKWRAFLILSFLFALFVFFGYIKSESIIRDLLIALLAVYGVANVGEAFVTRDGKKKDDTPDSAAG